MSVGLFEIPTGRVRLRTPHGDLGPVVPGQALAGGSPQTPPVDPEPVVAPLFAPEVASWEWGELPTSDGAVMTTYPYPAAPTAADGGPTLLTERSVVTGNASGLGPAGSTYAWTVEGMSTRPSITSGPLLRAHRSGTGTPFAVTCTITPPSGDPIVHTMQATCLSMDSGRGQPRSDVGGRERVLDVRFQAPEAGEYRVLWEQVDDLGQLLGRAERLSTVSLTAGAWHTATLPVTPPTVADRVTYAWRCVIEDPSHGVHVASAVYDSVHPAAVTGPLVDDRLPVPAGPLAQQVTGFPLQAPGHDAVNPTMTQSEAVAQFTGRILTGGLVVNNGAFGIGGMSADMGSFVVGIEVDHQQKMERDYGWTAWGQFVVPPVAPAGMVPPPGSDGTFYFYDDETHDYSETWKTVVDERGRVRATQAGHESLSTSTGAWTRPGAGVSAAGLMQGPALLDLYTVLACMERIAAGQSFDDLITHALLVAIPNVRGRINNDPQWVHPAKRSDGTGDSLAPIMGARFRLAAGVDMTGWSPFERVVGRWLQLYGCIVSDTTGGGVAIVARAYSERTMGGQPDPWAAAFGEGRGWTSALPHIGRTAQWEALQPGYEGTVPASMVRPPTITAPAPGPAPDPEPDPEYAAAISDSFSRTTTGGWGVAEVGGTWTTWGTSRSVDGSQGILTGAPASGMGASSLAAVEDQKLDLTFTLSAKPIASTYLGVTQRKVGADRVLTNINFRTDGTITVQSRADLATDVYFTSPVVGVSAWAAGDTLRLRSRVTTTTEPDGVTRRIASAVWLWKASDPMPAEPTATGSSAAAGVQALAAAGTAGIDMYVPAEEPAALTLAVSEWVMTDLARPLSDGQVAVSVDGATVVLTDSLS